MSDMVIYGHIWAYMIQYEQIRMDMSGWHVCKFLQHVPFSKLQSGKLSGVRFQVSVEHERPTKICQAWRHAKHACFAFPNWSLQKRPVKNDSTIFKNLQATRQVWESCRFCRFFGLLDLVFLPFSASWTTAGSVAITSNHGLFSAGSTVYCCDLLRSFNIFYVMPVLVGWPSEVLPRRSLGQNVRVLGWFENSRDFLMGITEPDITHAHLLQPFGLGSTEIRTKQRTWPLSPLCGWVFSLFALMLILPAHYHSWYKSSRVTGTAGQVWTSMETFIIFDIVDLDILALGFGSGNFALHAITVFCSDCLCSFAYNGWQSHHVRIQVCRLYQVMAEYS